MTVIGRTYGQSSTPSTLTDPQTGIVFNTWSASTAQTPGGLTFGFAMPSNALTTDATEFIGYLVSAIEFGRLPEADESYS
jgi:cellobiose dehydrogenase (acceptor)